MRGVRKACSCDILKTQCSFCRNRFTAKIKNFNCIVHGGNYDMKIVCCPTCGL